MRPSAFTLPLLLTVIGCGAAGDGSGDSVGIPQDPGERTTEWRTFVTADWSMPAGTEGYVCARKTVTEDLFVTGFDVMAPAGSHHSLVTLGLPDAPDGVSPCQFDTVFPVSAFGAGVGTRALEFPPGIARKIVKGTQVLLNFHLFNAYADELSGTSGVRIRTIAKSQVVELAEHVAAGPATLQIPARATTTHTGYCTMRGDVTLLAVGPHMHLLGRHEKVVAETAAGEVTLLDAAYDFEDQSYYELEPLKLAQGERVRVECTHENTTDAMVSDGQSSLAEMCVAGLIRYPAGTQGSFVCND